MGCGVGVGVVEMDGDSPGGRDGHKERCEHGHKYGINIETRVREGGYKYVINIDKEGEGRWIQIRDKHRQGR